MRIVQHVPGFVEMGDDQPEQATVSSVAEMLALPWVRRWEDFGFKRWSISDRRYLMAEMTDGPYWVVAIIIEGALPVGELPEWQPPA